MLTVLTITRQVDDLRQLTISVKWTISVKLTTIGRPVSLSANRQPFRQLSSNLAAGMRLQSKPPESHCEEHRWRKKP